MPSWDLAESWISHVLHRAPYLIETTTDRDCNYTDLGKHFADIFSKTNQVSLTLEEKQLPVFVAKDKIWVFKHERGSFWIPKDVSDEIGSVINKGRFLLF